MSSPERNIPEEFATLWSAWAKKRSRGQAFRTFVKLTTKGALPPIADLVETAVAWQRTPEWSKENRRFQPHLSTWLNAEGFLDELPPGYARVYPEPPKQSHTERMAHYWLEVLEFELGCTFAEWRERISAATTDEQFLDVLYDMGDAIRERGKVRDFEAFAYFRRTNAV